MNKNNIIAVIVIVIALAVGAWFIFSNNSSDNNSVAEDIKSDEVIILVNGEEIFGEDFQQLQSQLAVQQGLDPNTLSQEVKNQFEQQITEALISQKLINQKVQESNISVSDEQVDQEIESIKQQFQSVEEFQAALSSQGVSEDQIREDILNNLKTQNYLEQELSFSEVTATQAEVESFYQQVSESGQQVPPIEEVYQQVEQAVIQQKQQTLVSDLIEKLRSESEIEILI